MAKAIKLCDECGHKFMPKQPKHQKYCSRRCRRIANRDWRCDRMNTNRGRGRGIPTKLCGKL